MVGRTIVFVEGVSIVLNEASIIDTIGSIDYNLSVSCNSEFTIRKLSIVYKLGPIRCNVELISYNFESSSCKLVCKFYLTVICNL